MAPKRRNPYDRFLEKTEQLADGCIVWTAYKGENGYGRFYVDGRGALAHRWSYQFHVGPIPDGLVIDHLCRNHACVNPEHLEPVTTAENVRRGEGPRRASERSSAVTHCPQGHQYSDENTYFGGRGRTCLACKKDKQRQDYVNNRDRVIARSREWRLANPERSRELSRDAQRRRRAQTKAEAA